MIDRSFLKQKARESHKTNGGMAVFCFIMAAFLCGSAFLLSYFSMFLALVVLPILVFPIMFTFQRAIIVLREDREAPLTFGLVFSGFGSYFRPRFVSTYCFFREVWKIIVVYFGVAFLGSIISFICFYFTNYLGFYDMLKEITALPYITIETFDQLMVDYYDTLTMYMVTSSLPAVVLASIFGFSIYSLNSTSFFLRISGIKNSGPFIKKIFIRFKRTYFSDFFKAYMYLNWPLLVIFVLGFGLGIFVGSLYSVDVNSMFAFGLAIATFLSFGIFGSFYFANKEAIYFYFVDKFENVAKTLEKEFYSYLKTLKYGEEEIKIIEKELNEDDEDDEDDYEE